MLLMLWLRCCREKGEVVASLCVDWLVGRVACKLAEREKKKALDTENEDGEEGKKKKKNMST